MSVDIYMNIIKGKDFIVKDFCQRSDSEWFDELTGRGWNPVYDSLPIEYQLPEECPDEIVEKFKDKGSYRDFRYISVYDMATWLRNNVPWKDAGWATEYEKWNYNLRGIVPNDGFPHYKPEKTDEPYYFIEYEKPYDSGKWLYDWLCNYFAQKYITTGIPKDEILIYYFC